ncbi:hypothetical protein [Acidianus sp. RZ1]|uniref:hypothetical protein n=1 Tax=Acidianus sp. RZ1 TaxID=1540082 RepID=UPI001492AE58|nr:hypothetical protein [Acidianus sp. RZ1]NON61376.1 hypothetical protein [Acidianus sp. RZ1]
MGGIRVNSITSLFLITLLSVTLISSMIYVFMPKLVGEISLPSGTIEYFKDIDGYFLIKVYFKNGSSANPVNAIITVIANEPHNVKTIINSNGSTLKIPFSEILPYAMMWNGRKVNTSLLVIASYIEGNKTYIQTMEIPYNPSWVIENLRYGIIANMMITPLNLVKNISAPYIKNVPHIKAPYYIYNPPGGENCYPLIFNITCDEEVNAPNFVMGYYIYEPTTTDIVYNDLQVPINWVILSKGVINNDNFSFVEIQTNLNGKVSWFAYANSSGYIGTSFSENVNWQSSPTLEYSQAKLLGPGATVYTYYNATFAIIKYEIKLYMPRFGYIPAGSTYVFEVLNVGQNIGSGIGSQYGYAEVYYTNSSGTYIKWLPYGNSSIYYYLNYLGLAHAAGQIWGYATWSNGNLVNIEPPLIYSSAPPHIGTSLSEIDYQVQNNEVGSIILDAALDVLPFVVAPGSVALEIAIDLGLDALSNVIWLVMPSNVLQNYASNTWLQIFINGSGTIFVSLLNASNKLSTLLQGFVLNYSDYYYGDY